MKIISLEESNFDQMVAFKYWIFSSEYTEIWYLRSQISDPPVYQMSFALCSIYTPAFDRVLLPPNSRFLQMHSYTYIIHVYTCNICYDQEGVIFSLS